MEKDTIILSVDKYNELRDFKLEIEKGNILKKYSSRYGYSFTCDQDPDDSIKLMAKENKDLADENENLKIEIIALKLGDKPKELAIEDIKKMTYFQFIKWKNKKQ